MGAEMSSSLVYTLKTEMILVFGKQTNVLLENCVRHSGTEVKLAVGT